MGVMRFLAGLLETGVLTLLCSGCFSPSDLVSAITSSVLCITCFFSSPSSMVILLGNGFRFSWSCSDSACLLVSSGIASVISSSVFSKTCFLSSLSADFFPTAIEFDGSCRVLKRRKREIKSPKGKPAEMETGSPSSLSSNSTSVQ